MLQYHADKPFAAEQLSVSAMSNINRRIVDPPIYNSPDSAPVRSTSEETLDFEKVRAHLENANRQSRLRGAPTDPMEYLLHKQCLIEIDGDVLATIAGVLCFGKNPQATFPKAIISLARYSGDQQVAHELLTHQKIEGTLLDQIRRVEDFVWANIGHRPFFPEGQSQRIEQHQIPFPAIRELGVNMVAHRDYEDFYASARVIVYRNHIEWINPGGLPPGITVENILKAQMSRNPIIVSILDEAGFIEQLGQGLDTVYSVLQREGLPPPLFQDKGAFFVAAVTGHEPDDDGNTPRLTPSQHKIVALLQQNSQMTLRELEEVLDERGRRSIQRDLAELLDARVILDSGQGKARYYYLPSSIPS